jgi:hypothetical protein
MAGRKVAQTSVGKGHATPTRKEREAQQVRPLVLDRKAETARRRTENRTRIARENRAMMTGDERNMPPQHQGAPRRFARDYIDSRITVGEFLLPASFIALIVMMFLPQQKAIVGVVSLGLFVILLVLIVSSIVLSRRLTKRAKEKFGADRLPPRYRLYIFARIAQMRRLRIPKPQVKRGEHPS